MNPNLTVLSSFKWQEAAQYVYNEHLSKPYSSNAVQGDEEFIYQDAKIPRPNHGLVHTLRVALYVSIVVKAYNAFNQPPLTSKDIEEIQLALLFYVVGRENEASFVNHKEEYTKARKKCAEAFEAYVKKNPKIQLPNERLQFYKQGIINPYLNSFPQYIIIRICHDLDLRRCYPQDKYQEKLNEASNYVGSLTLSLALLAEECLVQTGDRIFNNKGYNGPVFIRCSQNIDDALRAIDAGFQLRQKAVLDQLQPPFPDDFQAPIPETPWNTSPQLWSRIPKGNPNQPYHKCEVLPDDPEAAFIVRYFLHSKPPKYSIKKIYVVHNPILTSNFEEGIKNLEKEAENAAHIPQINEPKDQRARVINRWIQCSIPFSPVKIKGPKRSDEINKTKVLPLWQGTTQEKCNSICTSGFTFFGKHHHFDKAAEDGKNKSTDIGFFGSGIYFTSSSKYASMYSNDGNLLLAWVSMREPYPIVNDIPLPQKGTDMRVLEGKGAYQNYSAHYVPVASVRPNDPNCMLYYACDKMQLPAWDEYVVFNKQHTLPRFWVELALDTPEYPLKSPFSIQTQALKTATPLIKPPSDKESPWLILNSSEDLVQISQNARVKVTAQFVSDISLLVELASHIHLFNEIDFSESGLNDLEFTTLIPTEPVQLQKIDLSNCKITDESLNAIPSAFPSLTSINLKECKKLSSTGIISLVKAYPNLLSLNIYGCSPKLSDEVLFSLSTSCTRLTYLNLGGGVGFTDQGLSAIANSLTFLTTLNLYACFNLTDSGPIAIAKSCPGLTSLDLGGGLKNLSDAGLITIAKSCKQLTSLSLAYCKQFKEATLITLAKVCSRITSLNLTACDQLTDTGLTAIAKILSGLTNLNLNSCKKVKNKGLIELAKSCTKLTSLDLEFCEFLEEEGFVELTRSCKNLTSLYITNSFWSLANTKLRLVQLPSCTNLSSLKLSSCNLNNEGVAAIGKSCQKLTSLDISFSDVSNEGLISLAKNCPGLLELDISHCNTLFMSDSGLNAIVNSCTRLTSLKLMGCHNITDNGLASVAKLGPKLTSLNLQRCFNITDVGLSHLAKSCPNLAILSLESCHKITDQGLESIAKACPHLKDLNISNCNLLSNQGLINLGNSCPYLIRLHLGNSKITINGLLSFVRSCPRIEFLHISRCNEIPETTKQNIQELLPDARIVF